MSGTLYDRSTLRNYFPLPNGIFSLGLKPGELSVFSYLMCCENRRTFTCYPSYETIGRWTGMTKNTVAKYVRSLEERRLITTEPTTVSGPDGIPRNGTLRYTILPFRLALEYHMERQTEKAQLAAAQQKVTRRVEATRSQKV